MVPHAPCECEKTPSLGLDLFKYAMFESGQSDNLQRYKMKRPQMKCIFLGSGDAMFHEKGP